MSKVGFIGLGAMGRPMVRNVAKAGYDVVLYDQDDEALRSVADEIGGTPAASPADFRGVEAIVLMLPTSKIVASALFDWEDGIPAHIDAETVIIDMSSSDPTDTVTLGGRLQEFRINLVDAPVSGGVERATTGTLSIMMGADDEQAAQQAMPIVETMSERIFRTGKLGTGHAMKALNNFVAAAATTASCEALVAGQRFGLDPATMVEIFNASTGQSFVTQHVLPEHVVNKKYASGFGLALYAKDVGIAHSLTQAMNQDAPVCRAVSGTMNAALEELGNVDHTVAMKFWEQQ